MTEMNIAVKLRYLDVRLSIKNNKERLVASMNRTMRYKEIYNTNDLINDYYYQSLLRS